MGMAASQARRTWDAYHHQPRGGLLFIPQLLPFLFDLFGKVFFVH